MRYVTGQVVAFESLATPVVSGSGRIDTTYRPLSGVRGYSEISGWTRIDTAVTESSRFWLRETSGRESLIENREGTLAVREGQTVSALYVSKKTTGREEWVAIANHTSGEGMLVKDPASILRALGFDPSWTEQDARPIAEPPNASWAQVATENRDRILVGIAIATGGACLMLIGVFAALIFVFLIGIGLFLFACADLLRLGSDLVASIPRDPVRPPIVSCSVTDEFAQMIWACVEARFRSLPPP